MKATIGILCAAILALSEGGFAMTSGDAYIRREDAKWTMGTAAVERIVTLDNGMLVLKSLKNKATGRELAAAGSEELAGGTRDWKLVDSKESKLKQGEMQLDITLQRGGLQATKTYVIYPASSVIREWVTFTNAGSEPMRLANPGFLNARVLLGKPKDIDFNWMTGGENQPGSWLLKTEALEPGKSRKFDAWDPFPQGSPAFPGDGVNAKITLNDKQVWPASGWQYVANATVTAPVDVTVDVAAGDKIAFVVNMNANIGWDTTAFDPAIAYTDGETHVASKEFTDEQGKNGWRYQYLENGEYHDLVYYPEPQQWRKKPDNTTGTPFVGASSQHPDVNQDAARVWTAPKAGRVHITASICNTGNTGSTVASNYGFKMGSSSYAPWYALYDRASRNGLFIGWDYIGRWASAFETGQDGGIAAELHVAGYDKMLKPGESVTTPKAFIGLYSDDLDNAGNELLDWQYRYLWDYTREGWFPAIRMLGYWIKGTSWGQPGVSWTGGKPDWDSTYRKVFRVADLMRYVGADVYHRDWGWWDRAGDWNGPDFRSTGEYLRKSGMGQLIYAFLYTVDLQSKVAKEHPDWVFGNTLDMSRPEVVEFMKGQLDSFVEKWGDFEWRNDSYPTSPNHADETPLLGQDQGLREVIKSFLDKYPKCAFQAVNGGGTDAGYDYVRYASTLSFSDGAVGILRNYYASLLFPPDKTSDIPDAWDPDKYSKAVWRGLLCINFDMTGDTWDPAKIEGIRELIDIYHYLHKHGVVGRWVKVYRPVISGDDPTMYLQRLSGDGKRGIIITKHTAPGAITVKPKGLLPNESYFVSFHESQATSKRTGAELMRDGIKIEYPAPGELIYLNLPLHPGSKLDKTPPTPPTAVTKKRAENMGYPGVELRWKPGADDNWVSYYEILRDGAAIDKVAKGAYYFDHSTGADLAATYEVRTVDGAGNTSAKTAAPSIKAQRSQVFDDTSPDIVYTGKWDHQSNLLPANNGTVSRSDAKGASAEVSFEGKRVLIFAKLGADCGKAEVSIDGAKPEVIDTYSADDIWGACVYKKDLPTPGKHTVRITVAGEAGERAKGTFVSLDGIRVEME